MANGKLLFKLHGEKLAGLWELVRIAKPGDKQERWFLFEKRDVWARPLAEYDVIVALPDSVVKKPLGRLEERAPRGGAASARTRSPQSAADLPGAVKANLPATLAPQLATLATNVPASGEWSYEIKFDGYRLLARIEQGRARLFTRNGNDWTAKLKALAAAVETLGIQTAWLDGEIVVLNQDVAPDFNENAFDASRTDSIDYFLFDLPYLAGHDLRHVPLHARRALLKQLVEAKGIERVRFSADFSGDPTNLLASAPRPGFGRRVDAPYVSARAPTWLKLKSNASQEFVIGGFTDRAGSAVEVGGLLLGYHDPDGKLQYAGNIGTGWNAATGAALRWRRSKWRAHRSHPVPSSRDAGRSAPPARSTGSSQSWWPRSVSPSGRPTAASASRCSRVCAATRRPALSRAKPRPRRRARQRLPQRTERAP
jgi:bifunctional non-homologous end joining protein LigD